MRLLRSLLGFRTKDEAKCAECGDGNGDIDAKDKRGLVALAHPHSGIFIQVLPADQYNDILVMIKKYLRDIEAAVDGKDIE